MSPKINIMVSFRAFLTW